AWPTLREARRHAPSRSTHGEQTRRSPALLRSDRAPGSVPEADRGADVAVAGRLVGGEREAQAARAEQVELPHGELGADRAMEGAADAVEPRRLPVRTAAQAQPAGEPLVLGAAARRYGDGPAGALELLHAERLDPVAVPGRPGHHEVGREGEGTLVAKH